MAASEQLQLLYAETVELSKIVQSTLKSARSPKS